MGPGAPHRLHTRSAATGDDSYIFSKYSHFTVAHRGPDHFLRGPSDSNREPGHF